MRHAIRYCYGKELCPFFWPVLAAGLSVFAASHQLLNILLSCNGFTWYRKLQETRAAADPQTETMTFFWCKFGFGKCFGASSRSSHWVGHCCFSYKTHFSSHITSQSRNGLLLHRIREDDTSKCWFFWFAVSSWGTHLLSFFTFPVCFKCQTIIEWSTLSSWPTSCLVVRRLALMILSVGHYQLQMPSTVLLIFKALVSFAKLLELTLHCKFIISSWAKCILDVASCLCCIMTHFELK